MRINILFKNKYSSVTAKIINKVRAAYKNLSPRISTTFGEFDCNSLLYERYIQITAALLSICVSYKTKFGE